MIRGSLTVRAIFARRARDCSITVGDYGSLTVRL